MAAEPGPLPLRHTSAPGAFGRLLRRHRLDAGLTQAELGRRVPVYASSINRYEREGRVPTRVVVGALARALGLDGRDTDLLLTAAGYLPRWVGRAGTDWPLVTALATALADDALDRGLRADLAAVVETVIGRFTGRAIGSAAPPRRLVSR